MLSLLFGPLHKCLLHLTLYSDGLSDDLSILFLGLSNSLQCIGVSFSLDLCSLGLSVGDYCSLNQICLGEDLIVLDLSLCIHLIDKCNGLFLHFSSNTLALSTHLLNFFLLSSLLKLGTLCLILTLLEALLFEILKRLVIILDAQVIRLLLALQGVLELEDGLFLKGLSHVIWQLYMGDDHCLNLDSFGGHY